ncbi:MAG: ATP-binding protein [Caldilineaceae bacterium]
MATATGMQETQTKEYTQWQYLQVELAFIDLLLRREVRRWVLAGQDPNDDYRGLYVTQSEAEQLLARPFGVSWGQWIALPLEEETALNQALAQARRQAEEVAEQMVAQGQPSRLQQLAAAFDLDRMALDILLLCLAPALDTKYERLYGYLQDNVMRRRPTVRLVLDLLGEPGAAKFCLATYLAQDAPLFQHKLLESITEAPPNNMHWINQTLQVDEGVVAWLLGQYQPPPELQGHVTLTKPEVCETDRLWVGSKILQRIQIATDLFREDRQSLSFSVSQSLNYPILLLYGIDGAAQEAAARWVAVQTEQPLLTVALDGVISESCSAIQTVRLALRDARLTGALAYLRGWDACLGQGEMVAPALLALVNEHPGPVILAGHSRWQPSGINRQRPIFQIEFGMPDYDQRLVLWTQFVETNGMRRQIAGPAIKPHKSAQSAFYLSDLANQFGLTSGQIRDAVTAARDSALQAGESLQSNHLFATARTYSNPRLSTLARKVTPRYTWEQMVLPADELAKLSEIVAVVKHRHQVLEVMGVGRQLAPSSGVMALFSGPPGTGKTMAAEVMAAVLQLDMYKIELSGVVSKYIGETEKNLERIFSEAANSNAILFFDEADALFGKRSEVKDAHDRYANIEVAYLLQRMELYEGVTILATNLRANLDEAFARRFFRTVEFPFPKPPERLRIWQTLFPPELPKAADVDFALLAKRFDLAGGNIRNVIHSGAVLAASDGGQVTMRHLLHGVRRELQKIGRLINEEDFDAI